MRARSAYARVCVCYVCAVWVAGTAYIVRRVPDEGRAAVTLTLSPRRAVHCSCLDFHQRFLCRHIFFVLRGVVNMEEAERDPFTPDEYGRRIIALLGATPWVGAFRGAHLARAVVAAAGSVAEV